MEIGGQVPILVTAVVPRGWFLDCFQAVCSSPLRGPIFLLFQAMDLGNIFIPECQYTCTSYSAVLFELNSIKAEEKDPSHDMPTIQVSQHRF